MYKKRILSLLTAITLLSAQIVIPTYAESQTIPEEPAAAYTDAEENSQNTTVDQSANQNAELTNDENEEHILINTKEFRNLEVYVTDGYSPISGAAVSISDMTILSDENGIAYFEHVPTSDGEARRLVISSDVYGERVNDIVIPYTMNVEGGDTIRLTISYWTIETASAVPLAQEENNEQGINALSADSCSYISGVPSGAYCIKEYNGLIYCLGESENKVYNPSTGTWAQLSSGTGIALGAYYRSEPILCNGKIYNYLATYSSDGEDSDNHEYYKSESLMFCYDLSTGDEERVLYSKYGGRYYDSVIECGGKIYFAGGRRIEEDTGGTMENYDLNVFNPSSNIMDWIGLSANSDIVKAAVYNNGSYDSIYYFSDGGVERLDIPTGVIEVTETNDAITNFEGASACASHNRAYFIGGIGASSTLRTYDFYLNDWLPDITMPNPRNKAAVQYYEGKIYILGGYDDTSQEYMTGLDIYDVENNTWTSEDCTVTIADEKGSKSLIYDGKLYVLDSALSRIGVYTPAVGDTADYVTYEDENGTVWRRGLMTDDSCPDKTKSSSPLKVIYPYGIREIDSYRDQTLAINEIGQVVAWGEGYYADNSNNMEKVTYPKVIEGIDNPRQVSRGKNHNLVLDKNGDVWGWGSNSNYPMGNYSGKLRWARKLDISDVKQVAAGTEFSIFLKNDGTLWGVGKNDVGQLGQGGTENASYSSPVQITDEHNFKKVSVGEDYVMALTNSNELYTWGSNEYGQLGNGIKENMNASPQKITIDLTDGEYISDIEAGVNFAMALTHKGNVYAWGDNGSGALGQNNKASSRTPKKVKNITGITSIAGGKSFALAIKNNGEAVYGWGFGRDGQLGFDATGSILLPREVTALSNKGIKAISCGNAFSVALGADGSIYTFGNNANGQLGIKSDEVVEVSSSVINDLNWLREYISNISQPITQSITLPSTAPNGSEITWTSSNSYYIANDGTLVNRPDAHSDDKEITLTATITKNERSIIADYEFIVPKDENLVDIAELPARVIENQYETDSSEMYSYYFFDEDENNESEIEVETAEGSGNDITVINSNYSNCITSQQISMNFSGHKKVTGIIRNNNSDWGVNILPTDNFNGWCTSTEVTLPTGAEDPFYPKGTWVTNAVCDNKAIMVLYPMSDQVSDFKLSYYTTEADEYEPNQYEIEAGMPWKFDNETTETKYNEAKAQKFMNTVGSRNKMVDGIKNLNFDSYADIDVYPIDVKKDEKVTVCVEMYGCTQEESKNYVIGIANNIRDKRNYQDYYSQSISYIEDFYYCKSFHHSNIDNKKQTLFATWVANGTGRCYITLGRKGIDGQKGRSIEYDLTATKTSYGSSDIKEAKDNSWYTNDFISINGKVVADDLNSGCGSGDLDNQLDIDWFKYTATETGYKRISINGAGYFAIAHNGNLTNGGGSYYNYYMEQGQTYYIGVYCPDGTYNSIMNNPYYTLTITDAGGINELTSQMRKSAISISLGNKKEGLLLNDSIDCYKFTPSITGSYKFYSPSKSNLVGNLYEPVGNSLEKYELICSTEKMDAKFDFILAHTLRANKTYYIVLKGNNDSSITYDLKVEKYATPMDPYFSKQWGLMNTEGNGDDINILPAWEINKGDNVLVAIVDVGFDTKHEDLSNNINYCSSSEKKYPRIHGTHVAGILAGCNNRIGCVGVAPNAKVNLYPAGIENSTENSTDDSNKDMDTKSVLKALMSINEYNNSNEEKIKVVNCSFNTLYNQELKKTMQDMSSTLFVVGAGNDKYNLSDVSVYPPDYDLENMLVVASVDKNGNKARTSNYGGNTAVAAPGEDIYSSIPDNKYDKLSGTSMATPMVSGVAALIISEYPNASIAEIKTRILNSNLKTNDNLIGRVLSGGIVDAYYALTMKINELDINQVSLTNYDTEESVLIKEKISTVKNLTSNSDKTTEVFVNLTDRNQYDILITLLNKFSFECVCQMSITGSYLLKFDSIDIANQAIDVLNASDDVVYAEPNYLIRANIKEE